MPPKHNIRKKRKEMNKENKESTQPRSSALSIMKKTEELFTKNGYKVVEDKTPFLITSFKKH